MTTSDRSVSSTLRCPVDHATLDEHVAEGISFSACRRCSGVWFDREALHRHTDRPLRLPGRQQRRASVVATDPRKRDCPRCVRRLTVMRVAGVEIDQCDRCGGLWLDAGEYEAMRKQITAMHAPVGDQPFGPLRDFGEFAAEGALEIGLRAVFELLAEALS